jgi:hypothetical protein
MAVLSWWSDLSGYLDLLNRSINSVLLIEYFLLRGTIGA